MKEKRFLLDCKRWFGTGSRSRSGWATRISNAFRLASIASSLIGGATPYKDGDWDSSTKSLILTFNDLLNEPFDFLNIEGLLSNSFLTVTSRDYEVLWIKTKMNF